MRIWCHGSQEFLSAVRTVVSASLFDAKAAERGSTVAVDLDASDGLQTVEELSAAGYVVVGLAHPSRAKCLADAVRRGAEGLGLSHRDITSGAGHDAVYMARVAPTAMVGTGDTPS